MRFAVVLLALMCLAFGPPRPQIPDDSVSEADPYETRFRSLGAMYGAVFFNKSITYNFKYFFWGSTAGVCYYNSGSSPNRVELNKAMWDNGSETFKEMLMFHELGHCLLGRGHTNSTHSSGRPESLMNSYLFSQSQYRANRDAYLKELFTVNPRPTIYPLIGTTIKDAGDCQFHRQQSFKRFED